MNILIVIDVQRDFLPGGNLGITGGNEVIIPIQNLAHKFDLVIATRDFHPSNHMSFKDFGGIWPSHCVKGMPGAALAPNIDRLADVVISKGTKVDREAYSGFQGTSLGKLINNPYKMDKVTVVGLAIDYCVKETALDALKFSAKVTVDLNACRGISDETTEQAIVEMREAGIKVING